MVTPKRVRTSLCFGLLDASDVSSTLQIHG